MNSRESKSLPDSKKDFLETGNTLIGKLALRARRRDRYVVARESASSNTPHRASLAGMFEEESKRKRNAGFARFCRERLELTLDNLQLGVCVWPNRWSGGLAEIQRTILSFPSTYQLLPTYNECCGFSETGFAKGAAYFDILSPANWARFTWLPPEFKSEHGLRFISSNLEVSRRLKELLAKPIFEDPARLSDVRYIANGFIETWSRVFFQPTTGLINGHTVNIGDGTPSLVLQGRQGPDRRGDAGTRRGRFRDCPATRADPTTSVHLAPASTPVADADG